MNSEDENIPLSATPIPDSYTQDDDQLRKMVANYYIEYASYVIGRMGVPYRKRDVSVISVALDGPQDVISALSGKLGALPGISTKTIYAKTV